MDIVERKIFNQLVYSSNPVRSIPELRDYVHKLSCSCTYDELTRLNNSACFDAALICLEIEKGMRDAGDANA